MESKAGFFSWLTCCLVGNRSPLTTPGFFQVLSSGKIQHIYTPGTLNNHFLLDVW